jgi:hypothetical protein
MRALLRIDQNTSHGFEEVVENFFEVWSWLQGSCICKNVSVENFKEQLNINGREPDYWSRILYSQ